MTGAAAVSADELREILAGARAFASLPDAVLEDLARAASREFVRAGQRLLASGEPPGSAFVVEHGRLSGADAWASQRAGRTVAIEFGRGDICALGLLVAQLPMHGDVIAMRDGTVLRLRGEALLRCVSLHPELVVATARQLYELALRTHVADRARPRVLTLLPIGGGLAQESVVARLVLALSETIAPGSAVDARRAAEILGGVEARGEPARRRLSEWCNGEEERGRLVLLVCDREETPWTRWCLEQTDRIVVAACAKEVGAIRQLRRLLAPRSIDGSPVPVDLLLVHERGVEIPQGTAPWMGLEHRRRHHHVRVDRHADFQRAARRIGERAVAVVLGGGGARSLAHLGVLQALEDAGVPVDAVGGTSMGSVVAGGCARGLSPRQMLDLFASKVPHGRALRDLGLPRLSLMAGRKLDALLRFAFGDLDAADLWRPFFCISADLVEGRMVVHDRGPLWQAVRASCSLPGVFPPVRSDGRLLVDGGIVDNVAIDVMEREHPGSTIVAVDVGGAGIGREDAADVNIVKVLTSSTTIGSREQLKHLVSEGHADLFLAPPVNGIQLLAFDARDALFELGYRHAREQLDAWSGLARVAQPVPRRDERVGTAPPHARP